MMKRFVLVLLVVLVGCAPAGQAADASTHRMTGGEVALHMNDGPIVYGVVESDDATSLYVMTPEGNRVRALKASIGRVELFTSARARRREFDAGAALCIALAAVAGVGLLALLPMLLFSGAHF